MPQGRQAPRFDPAAPLTPVASPVDTYRGAPVANPMLQLAGALKDLNPALNTYMGVEKQKLDATDFQAGQLAYMKAKANLKEAVNAGTIQAGFSPAFRRGYEQGNLRVLSLNYDQQLREAYTQSASATSDDPTAFQGFVADFTSQYMEKNNIQKGYHPLDVGEAFTPGIDAAQRSLAHFHVEQRAKTIEDDWSANTQNEISTTIDNAVANKMSSDQIGDAVTGVVTKAMANGWHDKSDFNKNLVQLIAAKAEGSGDVKLLDVMKRIPTGPGGNLGNTTYARDKALEVTQKVQNQTRDDVRWEWAKQSQAWSQEQHTWAKQEHARTMQDWAIEKNAGTLLRALISQAIIDPTQNFDKQVLQLTNMDRDGSHARTFLSFRQSAVDAKDNGTDKPGALTGLYQDMLNNPQTFDPRKIVNSYSAGNISRRTMTSLMDDQRRIAETGASPILRDPVYQTLRDGVTKAYQGNPNEFDVTKVSKTTEAMMSFQRHALEYLAKNKDNLDNNKFYDEMQKYQQHLIKPLLDAEKPVAKPQKGKGGNNPYAQPGMNR